MYSKMALVRLREGRGKFVRCQPGYANRHKINRHMNAGKKVRSLWAGEDTKERWYTGICQPAYTYRHTLTDITMSVSSCFLLCAGGSVWRKHHPGYPRQDKEKRSRYPGRKARQLSPPVCHGRCQAPEGARGDGTGLTYR